MTERPRIWVDTRNAIFRYGLKACLRARCAVVGESADLEPRPELTGVDVLLFDIEALEEARPLAAFHETALVALVPQAGDSALGLAVEAGLAGFLVRPDLDPVTLRRCLETILEGGRWYPAAGGDRPAGDLRRHAAASRLAARELAVLRLLAGGSRTQEIALALSYSERTVKNIVHDLLTKLDCRTRAHAVAIAIRSGAI
jgi:DNA-binding NarL/FixJ family response regulator